MNNCVFFCFVVHILSFVLYSKPG